MTVLIYFCECEWRDLPFLVAVSSVSNEADLLCSKLKNWLWGILSKSKSWLLQPTHAMKVWLWKVWGSSGSRSELVHEALEQISLGILSTTFQPQVVLVTSSNQKLVLHNCIYVQVSLFLLQHCLSKNPAPMLGKWLDGFVLKQAPKLLFMGWLSTKCWDKLVDTGVSVLQINCNKGAVAEWELCTLICPINCCLYIFCLSISPSCKICCNRHQLLLLLLECAVQHPELGVFNTEHFWGESVMCARVCPGEFSHRKGVQLS